MPKHSFDELIDRRNTGSIKWGLFGDDVLPLWVADMDFPVMDEICDALSERINHPFFGYQKTDRRLYELICEWILRRHQWRIDPEHILLAPGVVSGFNWIAGALVDTHEAVAFQTPVYFPFYKIARNQNINQINLPLQQTPEGYRIDFEQFEIQIAQGARLFLLCNPHNPVGRVFNRKELEQMGELCLRNDVYICADEIHSDIVYPDHKHLPIASISPELSERTITLMAPSKTFNIPGLQFAYAICSNKEIRTKLEHARRGMLDEPNILATSATIAAYKFGEPWLDDLLEQLKANRDYLIGFLKKELLGIDVHSPEGTYLAWLDCSRLGLLQNPFEFFLKQAKVALNDGKMFADNYAQFVRLNFACPRTILESALNRMAEALQQIEIIR